MMLQELASRLGISVELIEQFEMDKYEIKLAILLKIACALKVSVVALVGERKAEEFFLSI